MTTAGCATAALTEDVACVVTVGGGGAAASGFRGTRSMGTFPLGATRFIMFGDTGMKSPLDWGKTCDTKMI